MSKIFYDLETLKNCFMEPLKKVQVEGHLMFAEPQDLFGNLDELCYVSYTFCRDFIKILVKECSFEQFGTTKQLVQGIKRFCELTRDAEVYHDYCLNYPKAICYLEQLRKNEDFCDFEKWCEQDQRCKRLQLTDLLIAPLQHCTKVPLLLANIRHYTLQHREQLLLQEALEQLESSLKNLEVKMASLKNFERIQEIQQQIIWLPVTELEPRAFIPEEKVCDVQLMAHMFHIVRCSFTEVVQVKCPRFFIGIPSHVDKQTR
ncbi:hypothetical protein HELRODRAFT_160527 [Helobdella robusta]|uniref:DH domain-containing protein n=1 Tax=Helobdella robusta TaxID=6412 RepID=T1EQD0_HELRO|nr:hypothetical protein HELRODRAFT_160527 [Helobdella robusta]ESO06360.1 hypothetical protein HELRODRAFT_160527 [Helobdella robusta]